mmetsp:Transcript_64358/g.153515  ORF Transcript_64358/g.153515 Transcript_64358/m.153515 type:complete len:269 (-) Transcript_64358:426-1232(-)
MAAAADAMRSLRCAAPGTYACSQLIATPRLAAVSFPLAKNASPRAMRWGPCLLALAVVLSVGWFASVSLSPRRMMRGAARKPSSASWLRGGAPEKPKGKRSSKDGIVYHPAFAATAFCTRPPPTFPRAPGCAGASPSVCGVARMNARCRCTNCAPAECPNRKYRSTLDCASSRKRSKMPSRALNAHCAGATGLERSFALTSSLLKTPPKLYPSVPGKSSSENSGARMQMPCFSASPSFIQLPRYSSAFLLIPWHTNKRGVSALKEAVR